MGAYDNEQWNISVRLKPDKFPFANVITGANDFDYTLEFRGINAVGNTIQNSFLLTASIGRETGSNFLSSSKRMYVGANRANITGALVDKSDVLFSSLKYWAKYIENSDLKQHLFDVNNRGISGSYKNVSALDANLKDTDVANLNALALNWTFDNITGSDGSGNFFYVRDYSSG